MIVTTARVQVCDSRATRATQTIMKALHRQAAGCSLTFRWVPGHKGITGNELADKEAKKAAEGSISPTRTLPKQLQRELPTSLSMARKVFMYRIKKRWGTRFRESARYKRIFPTNIDLNPMLLHKSLTALPQSWCSLMVRLQSGHVALNAHL